MSLKRYKVDLDLPFKDQYRQIIEDHKDGILSAYHVLSLLNPLSTIIEKLSKFLASNQVKEYHEMLELTSEITGLNHKQIGMIYISAQMACTSIVTQDKDNNIILARNLDWETFFIGYSVTYEAEFYKKGELEYIGIGMAGIFGLYNAVKPGKFAISMNSRESSPDIMNVPEFYKGYLFPLFAFDKVMKNCNSYSEAVNYLANVKLSLNMYFTIAGINKNEGMIMERTYEKMDKIYNLDVDNGIWFQAITNSDKNLPEPDDDYRREPAEKRMKIVGREGITKQKIFDEIMSLYPTNNLETIFTTVMEPGMGYFNTTVYMP